MAEAQPGDLIAWDNSSRNNGVDHIAIYIGNGKMIEAPRTGLDVRIIDVPSTPDVIRRILPEASGASAVSGVSGRQAVDGYAVRRPVQRGVGQVRRGRQPARLRGQAGVRLQPEGGQPGRCAGPDAADAGHRQGLGVQNSFDPNQAVDGAARLLRDLLNRFDRTDLALAAYNAGPGAVLRYDGIPPYPETQNYVRSVMSMMEAAA